MFEKSTDELTHALKVATTPEDYLAQNSGELLRGGLAQELARLLKASGRKKAEVVRHSGLNRVYAYQIFLGQKTPSRDKLIALCLGMGASLSDTQRLLKASGCRELYVRDPRDVLLIHAISMGMRTIEANEVLFGHEMEILE